VQNRAYGASAEGQQTCGLLRTVDVGEQPDARVAEGYVNQTPFRREGRAVIKLDRSVETGRTRRLEAGDEGRLLKHADSYIHDLIIGLLDTGCRRGELLGLRWKDVRLKDGVIVLRAEATKTNTTRAVPISQRLKAILEMRRHGPDGKELAPDAYVFGTETGERRRDTRNAWLAACDKAGITDLQMHDLRRECGSRLLESGAGLHEVREWLGHTDIGTTGRYLAVTAESLKRTLKRLEEHQATPPPTKSRPPRRTSARSSASSRVN
jgi:integrase